MYIVGDTRDWFWFSIRVRQWRMLDVAIRLSWARRRRPENKKRNLPSFSASWEEGCLEYAQLGTSGDALWSSRPRASFAKQQCSCCAESGSKEVTR
jgi:hypothetical protein